MGLTADDFGGPSLEGCNELLNVTRPDVVRALHRSFLDVGVDVIETNTLLGAKRIGIEVGEATSYQYQPEQTTSAIICHHPQAKYFIARKPKEARNAD